MGNGASRSAKDKVQVLVKCNKCAGSGRRPLTKVETNTLASVDPTWQTTAQIRYNLGPKKMKMSAVLWRLQNLQALGLVESQGKKPIEWRLATGAPNLLDN